MYQVRNESKLKRGYFPGLYSTNCFLIHILISLHLIISVLWRQCCSFLKNLLDTHTHTCKTLQTGTQAGNLPIGDQHFPWSLATKTKDLTVSWLFDTFLVHRNLLNQEFLHVNFYEQNGEHGCVYQTGTLCIPNGDSVFKEWDIYQTGNIALRKVFLNAGAIMHMQLGTSI